MQSSVTNSARLIAATLLNFLFTTNTQAQSGTVIGHVVCADTQTPARSAVVYLVNAPTIGKSPFDNPGQISERRNGDWVTHTLLDGSFVLRNLPPGTYDLKIEYPGYIDPAPFLSPPKLEQSTLSFLMSFYTQVTVQAGRSVYPTATIYRGAEVSGSVTYDDGSPVEGFTIRPLLANLAVSGQEGYVPHDGSAADSLLLTNPNIQATTDARGRYQISGLIEGTYSIQISPPAGNYIFPVYLGNTIDRSQAKLVTVKAGEERSNLDINMQLNSYRQVRGTLMDGNKQPLPKTSVALGVTPKRPSIYPLAVTSLDDGSFVFPYVPDGNYTLSLAGGTEMPIIVRGTDITDLVLSTKP